MREGLLLPLLLSCLLLSSHLLGKDTSADDLSGFSELDGFSDENSKLDASQNTQENTKASNFSSSGSIAFKTSYGYRPHSVDGVDYSRFNQAQIALFLQLDYKINSDWKIRVSGDSFYDAIYDIYTQKKYNQNVLNTYKKQLRFDDTYIQGRVSQNIDISVGRQIVVWGKSDSVRVTDVINPLDNRLPGLTDIKDLRLSTTMFKLDYYIEKWNLSAMIIPESRIFLEPAPRGEFFPVEEIFPVAPKPFIALAQPTSSWENTQYAFAANGVFLGWDLSFYGANVLDSKWHLEGTLPKAMRVVSKINMLGSAINVAWGSFLFKSEIAYFSKLRYNSTQNEKNRIDTLGGFDYMGIKDTVVSLEVLNRHIFDYESQMSGVHKGLVPDYIEEDEMQTALRLTRSFSNDSINATALISMFGHNWEYGGFARFWVEVELANALNANIGIVDYRGGNKPFIQIISNNDRIFADITYSF